MRREVHKGLLWLVSVTATSLWMSASSAAEPEDIIKYRQAVMKSQGGHMGAAARIVQGKVDFAGDLLYHVEALSASLKTVIDLFPADSDFGETKAKLEIWQKRAAFDKAARNADKEGTALLAAVKANDKTDTLVKFKALAEACKGCHKDFREED